MWSPLIWLGIFVIFESNAIMCPPRCSCGNDIRSIEIDCSFKNVISTGIENNGTLPINVPVTLANYSHNLISDLDESFAWINVKNLDLSYNKISKFPNLLSKSLVRLEVLNLSYNDFQTLPDGLPQSLKLLRFSHNRIKTVDMFSLITLDMLQSLYLDFNAVEEIVAPSVESHVLPNLDTFSLKENSIHILPITFGRYLSNVSKLSFFNNCLREVSSSFLDDLNSISYLDLSFNELEHIEPNLFKKSNHLKYLLLSNNKLTALPSGLPMLEWLDISNNNITQILESQSADIYPQEMFLIGGNPFHCVCDLLWLKEFYATREYLKNYVYVDVNKFVPICSYPEELAGMPWDSLDDAVFGCNDKDNSDSQSIDTQKGESENENYSWKTKNLHLRIKETGDTFIHIEWASVSLTTDVILFTYHPFGNKYLKKKSMIHPHMEKFVITNLKENTPYVICISLISDEEIVLQKSITISQDDCLEAVTMKTNIYMEFPFLFILAASVFLFSATFYLKCWSLLCRRIYDCWKYYTTYCETNKKNK